MGGLVSLQVFLLWGQVAGKWKQDRNHRKQSNKKLVLEASNDSHISLTLMPTISCHLHLRLPCFNWSCFNSWSYLIEAALPQSIYAKDRTLWWFMRTTYLLSWIQKKNIKQLRFMSHRYIYIYKDYLIHREVWIWILRIDVTMPTLSSSGSLARLLSDSKIVGISVYYRFANDTVTSILLNSSEAPWFPIRYPKFIDGTVTLAAATGSQ